MHTLPMHGFQPDRTKTGLLTKKLYRSSILFSDKEATGRMVSHNKEADQTAFSGRQDFNWPSLQRKYIDFNFEKNALKANKKGKEHDCIAYIPILDVVETRDRIVSNSICNVQRHGYIG